MFKYFMINIDEIKCVFINYNGKKILIQIFQSNNIIG